MKLKLTALTVCLLLVAAWHARAEKDPICGDENVKFKVATVKSQAAPVAPTDGKAQIVFIEVDGKPKELSPDDITYSLHKLSNHAKCPDCYSAVRFGVDGAWAGANQGNSYFAITVPAGKHQVCANLPHKHETQFTSFTAEPNKTYYYALKITTNAAVVASSPDFYVVDFDPVKDEEGKLLVQKSDLSTWKSK